MSKQTLNGACCAPVLLDLHENTVTQRKANTGQTRQRRIKRVSFILEEVPELKSEWIEAARRRPRTTVRLVS